MHQPEPTAAAMPTLKPFLLERILLPEVWGGRALKKVLGLALPGRQAIGESWELFDRPEGSSRVRGSKTTLAELMQEHGKELLGARVAASRGGRFPLLIKFLDARVPLSVQVHPDDEQAKVERDGGKNEAWIVLHAGPNARLIHGLRPGVTAAELREKAHTPAVESLLRAFKPRVGDTWHVPAGTVHSIGPDVVVFEVQQNSDVTYRLYDWGRRRELHVQKALEVTRFRAEHSNNGARPVVKPVPLPDGSVQQIATPDFRVVRHDLSNTRDLATHGTFKVVTAIAGSGSLGFGAGRTAARLPMVAGDTALVPACTERFELAPTRHLTVLVSDPGER